MSLLAIAPWLAMLFGLYLGTLAVYTQKKILLRNRTLKLMYSAAGAWFLYSLWEIYCQIISNNIRVDLLFIYPLLVFISLLSMLFWVVDFYHQRNHKLNDRKFKNPRQCEIHRIY